MDEELIEHGLAEIEHAFTVLAKRIHRAKFLIALVTFVAAVTGILTMVDQSIKKQLLSEAVKLRQELMNADIRAVNRARVNGRAAAKPATEGA